MLTIAEFNRAANDYVAAFTQRGAATFIANLDTYLDLHRWGEYDLPITVNDGAAGTTFVCSPRIGYIDYPLEELAHFPDPRLVPLLRGIIKSVGAVFSLCGAERIVHINNWMLSTNLPVPLDSSLVHKQTDELTAKYPAHLLAMRSLTRRYNSSLMAALEAAGWALLPSRQIFLIEDFAKESMPRRDFKRDEALWHCGAYRYEQLSEMGEVDAARIITLYNKLYLDKYSRLNPAYTLDFVALTHRIGLIRYLVLRDREDVIQGFGGMYRAGQHATMPLLGYNTDYPQEHGLYRLSFHAGTRYALEHRLLFNLSSGATGFKRNRGATAEMEFTAFYLGHLPWSRRKSFALLQTIANRIGIPLLRAYDL